MWVELDVPDVALGNVGVGVGKNSVCIVVVVCIVFVVCVTLVCGNWEDVRCGPGRKFPWLVEFVELVGSGPSFFFFFFFFFLFGFIFIFFFFLRLHFLKNRKYQINLSKFR